MDRILIIGTNWIGDSIMSMPAVQALRRARPGARITVLVKPALVPLWQMHEAPDAVLTLEEGIAGTLASARRLRAEDFEQAFILPHSFRSALVPFVARVPARIGMPGHARDWMLTEVVTPHQRDERPHQACEYMALMAPETLEREPERPRLRVPEAAAAAARQLLASLPRPRAALLPGAARGPAKRWPAEGFAEAGRLLAAQGWGLAVLGAPAEAEMCGRVAGEIGAAAVSLAGRTSFAEWAAALKACDIVVANDSGGMHVAAAVGTPVVAIFGITDPRRTGPLAERCAVLQAAGPRGRDVPRRSRAAAERLASITPRQVYDAVVQLSAATSEREP
ncbi:MAG: lipopolysaccharide heptosyltransferase II [Kiritimatiellae bacterium]|nr:lipopolysaccharide heptosyltransferase II [Kiritimatiellia bacterium]